jgi:cytochrome c2
MPLEGFRVGIIASKNYLSGAPNATISGTKMAFAGSSNPSNPQEIDDVWAYVKQFDPKGEIKE